MKAKRDLLWTVLVVMPVLLTPIPAFAEIQGDFPEVVLFATNSMEIEASAEVFSGDVVVNQATAGTLSFGNKAKTPAGWEVKANTIDVGNNVTLAGTESCNFGDFSPCDNSLITPVYNVLPLFQTATAGGVNVNVPNSGSATISADALDVTIGLEGTVTFTPGVHSVRSITASKKADLVFTGPTELRIENGITMGVEANINLSGAAASQVILYVGGDATLGPKSTVNANVYTETGTLVISGNVIATGAFLAGDLIVETKAKIHLATFFDSPPVANDDAYSVDEDMQLVEATVGLLGNGVLANDTDAENDLLTAVLLTDVSPGATLVLNPDGSFTYDPDPDYYGADGFTYWACDELPHNIDNCDVGTVSITVDPVNDFPEFSAGADPVVSNEDATAQSVAWATAISAGAPGQANETDQTVSFNVSNDNNGLFSVQPSISATGDLSYTSTADANGSAAVTVSLSDNCPAALSCGGDAALTSADQTFTITVTAVNDEPSFAAGSNQVVGEDSPSQSVAGWATSISPGPADETGQAVSFNVSNDNNGLFSSQPAVDSGGNLAYTPAPDAFGSATVSVSAMDDGGTANGGDDTSDAQNFTITVTSVNDPPVPDADSASTPEEALVTIDVLDGDTGGPVNEDQTVTLDDVSQAASGTVTIVAGKVDYTPNDDFFGEDSFAYTVCDGGDDDNTATDADDLCSTGSVTVNVTNVNDAPTADQQELFPSAAVVITLTGSDPDGDSLTFTLVPGSGPTQGMLSAITPVPPGPGAPVTSATATYTPTVCAGDPLECAEDGFAFEVSDGSLTDTADVFINPGGLEACTTDAECGAPASGLVCGTAGVCEPAPVTEIGAKDDTVETNTGVAVEVELVAFAPATIDDLVFTIDSGPTSGSLSAVVSIDPVTSPVRSAKTTYTPTCTPTVPAASPTCTASFVFKACEVAVPANCDTATVEINVTPDDAPDPEPPVAEDMSVGTTTGVEMVFDLIATQSDPSDRTCVEDSECGPGFVCNGQNVCEPEGPFGPVAASAPVSAGPSAGGVNGASSSAASSAAPTMIGGGQPAPLAPITPDAGWSASPNFTWGGTPIDTPPCVPVGSLCPLADPVFSANTFEFTGDTCVTIVDDFFRGDRFAIYDNGQLVGATPVVAVTTVVDPGVGPDAALADPTRSSGTFYLGPGSHMLTIEVLLPSFQSGGDFLRVDSATSAFCDPAGAEGGTPLLTYTVTNVPAASFGILTDSAGNTITEGAVLTNPEVTFTPVATTGTGSFNFQVTNTQTGLVSNVAMVALDVAALINLCLTDAEACEDGRGGGGLGPVSGSGSVGGLPTGSGFRVEVSGPGDVTSSRPHADGKTYQGLVCASDSDCSANFVEGSTVVLFARPTEAGTEFVEWGGDCYGSDPVALVRAGTDTLCTATFRKASE